MADHQAVDAHRADGEHGVAQALALGGAGALGGDVDDVGREPLAGDLEARAGARRVLEEHVDHRAAAQGGELLDLAPLHVVHVGGGLEDLRDRRRRRGRRWRAGASRDRHLVDVVDLGQPHADALGCGRWGGSCRRGRRGWAARGGRGRPAPPGVRRRVGRGRRARRGRPGWCGRRRARRRRAPRPCRRCRRAGSRSCASAGSAACAGRRGTSSRRARRRRPRCPRRWRCARRCDGPAGTPRVWRPSRTRSAAPLLRSRISWEMRVRARAMSPESSTMRGSAMRPETSFSASRDGSLKDVAAGRDPQDRWRRPYQPAARRTVGSNRPSPVQRQELNMSVGYSAAYWWGITPWKKAGRRSRASFDVLLEPRGGGAGPAPGPRLDLGCGTGERTGHLVERGWDAVGIDNMRQAVDIAVRRTGVADTRFVVGDVRHLVHSGIGSGFSLVLDVGCFEGLDEDDRALVAAGVDRARRAGRDGADDDDEAPSGRPCGPAARPARTSRRRTPGGPSHAPSPRTPAGCRGRTRRLRADLVPAAPAPPDLAGVSAPGSRRRPGRPRRRSRSGRRPRRPSRRGGGRAC